MNYQRYKNARNLAWQIILDEGICSLPVNVGKLCRSLGISVRQYAGEDGSDGRSLIVDGRPLILVSQNKPVPRQRFTAAHELGHVLLGHVEEGSRLVNREPSPGDNPLEREANVFASRLLAPGLCALGLRRPIPGGYRGAVRYQPPSCGVPLATCPAAVGAGQVPFLAGRAEGLRTVCGLHSIPQTIGRRPRGAGRASA